ncbi:diiron oxygenase [Thiothrix subterranea]|uniref:Diiron oxygenase n=1 Tax=Thiothrix subterranea TaxID=2735563 RepID=A0AA51MKC0_9GAMM|nr:diiron oxygenase [Thiothrix subterranea]WML85289.1 diiron oxygenase [Thiothrix subterranea]
MISQSMELPENHTEQSDNNCILILDKLGKSWSSRAQVKNDEIEVDLIYNPDHDDFIDSLLPFHEHPRYLEIDDETRTLILSSGWIAYNEKTIDIEAKIISPVCNQLIYSELPGTNNHIIRWLAAETLVDEAYHILMVLNTCYTCRKQRGLLELKLPSFDLVNNIEKEVSRYSHDWQKKLVRLAACVVSEVFISDYLSLLANADEVQPVNRITTDYHRKDELAHSSIFRNLTKEIFHHLSYKEKTFFCQVLPLPVHWFASQEFIVWETILNQLNFKYTNEVIGDCRAESEINLNRIDYSELIQLASEVGVFDMIEGKESFERQGLLS